MHTHLPGYQIEEKVYESTHSVVYRALMEKGNGRQPVILKLLQPGQATAEGLGRFRREFEITHSLTGPDIIQAYALESFQNTLAIVLEDFGGQSLARWLDGVTVDIATFLQLAICLSDQLGSIHQQNVIHKDINPANIIWNRDSNRVKLIDFGLATTLSREAAEIRSPQILEGTLAYISPEQTGRMNRAMDYRTDYYSMGATFYQLLVGQPPFVGKDPIELVHAHIARQPTPPHELNTAVPRPLSDIIMRLLAKNAEDRYQSAYGLKADLENCLTQWQTTGRMVPFPLAQKDVVTRFQLPQKLYGRDAEIQTLLAAFHRVADPQQGAVELVLVTGSAGIGKTSLIREIHKPITMRRGYFIAGKFDQLHRTPYAALIHAFQELVNQILTENEAQISLWRQKLLAALGRNGQVIIDVIPTVALITGPQTAVPDLPPAEAENRFTLAFQNFMRVFAQADHPLVLFLDDWQWMDAGSRQLLQRLITGLRTRHLLIIGAYRDAEVGETHPVWQMVNRVQEAGIRTDHIALPPLTLPTVNQFIADTVHTTPAETRQLAELVQAKTDGNPFFMGEFMKSLVADGLVAFDYEQGRWRWDLPAIQAAEITDNVVELMMGNIQKLTPAAQTVLQLAACIGTQFDLETLALAYGGRNNRSLSHQTTAVATAVDLWEAIVAGLVIPLNDAYKLAVFDVPANAAYKFAHDRIQQAAYALIAEPEKQTIHRQIGQYLLRATPADGRDAKIFTILNHLNLAQSLLTSQVERDELAGLNLEAGQKALGSAAFWPALDYFDVGIRLLMGAEAWERCYDLTLTLHTQAAAAAYLSGRYEEMEQWAAAVMVHGRDLLHKLPVYETRIQAYTHQNRLPEALDTALPLLKELGVSLPRYPTRRHVVTAVLKTKIALRGKTADHFLDLPRLTDPHYLAVSSILSNAGVTAYFVSSELFALIVLELTRIYAKYGVTPFACRALASYGLILLAALDDIDGGYAYCEMSIKLLEKLNAPEMRGSTLMVYNIFVRHWKNNLRETLPALQEGYQLALAAGDPEFATYCAYGYSKHALHVGVPLDRLIPEMVQYGEVMGYYNKAKIHYAHNFYLQTAVNLSQPGDTPTILKGDYYDEAITVPQYIAANDRSALCAYDVQKAILCYQFGQPAVALKAISEAETMLPSIPGSNSIPLFYLFDSLIRLALYPSANPAEQKATLKKVAANQKKLQKWQQVAPMNFAHKQALVAAELCRLQNDHAAASEWYDQAIQLAAASQFLNEEALAWELAGQYYQGMGNGRLAQHYLQQAHERYTRWGAHRKAQELAERFPFLAAPQPEPLRVGSSTTRRMFSTTTTLAATAVSSTAALDLTSIIKASQTLSGEIVLAKLQDRLMQLVIENAGAQTGYLLLASDGRLDNDRQIDGRWFIAAYTGDDASPTISLPASLINYVARLHTAVVLDNATHSQFATDPAIQSRQPQSILCLPLLHHGHLTGMLYLENKLTTGAFTEKHLAVLNMLASQAAISIENAQLYGRLEEVNRTLEEKVAQRTTDLALATQEAESARAAAQKANEAKSAFLANMSHELRTPLNAIIGFTRIVRRRGSDTLPDKQVHNLDRVLVSAEQLLSLINTILDIAKIEAGHMDVQAANFNLGTVIDLSVTAVQPFLKPGVTLEKEIASDLPIIFSDQDKVRQILINLLSNAAKFTAHGRITIQASMLPNGEAVAVAISDTGIGIPEEAQARIFEEFQQAESTTRQQYGGIGLGLAISRSLANLLDGRITVSSLPDKGSTFTLTIPVRFREL